MPTPGDALSVVHSLVVQLPGGPSYSLKSPCFRGTGHLGGRKTKESSVKSESIGQWALRIVT